MANKFSIVRADEIDYGMWLAFSEDGSVRMSRGAPALARNERAMSLSIKVPRRIFSTPELSARIEIADPGAPIPQINIDAVSAALREVIGCDVEVTVREPT